MSKRKKRKKEKRSTVDLDTLVISATVDLIIGILLLIIEKLFF